MKSHPSLSLLALIAGLIVAGSAGDLQTAAGAQTPEAERHECLSREECRELRRELQPFRRELRPLRQEKRQLIQQIRELPEGEERDALIERLREVRREIRQLRREWRPEWQRFKNGCRRECFAE